MQSKRDSRRKPKRLKELLAVSWVREEPTEVPTEVRARKKKRRRSSLWKTARDPLTNM